MIIALLFVAQADEAVEEAPIDAELVQAGVEAFEHVYAVSQSPRCRNCHPAGDAPLQFDDGRPHAMGITRDVHEVGMTCTTCHSSTSVDDAMGDRLPPTALHWQMPPASIPMTFEGRSLEELCAQLANPPQTRGRTGDLLVHHVGNDPLVVWAWDPGADRTTPPGTHQDLVDAMQAWVDGGMPCPEPGSAPSE